MLNKQDSSNKELKRKKRLNQLRQVVQILTLILFLYLLVGTRKEITTVLPYDIFFRLDPLLGITSILASQVFIVSMMLGVFTIVLTIIAGRVWCGWLCPLGTILDWTPIFSIKSGEMRIQSYWLMVKYILLFMIVFTAIFSSLSLIIFDPITILSRTVTSVIIPGLSSLITFVEISLFRIESFQPSISQFDYIIRSRLLTDQPFFLPNLMIAFFFGLVLTLNIIRMRFWCRYLCPLGALLGIISKTSYFKYRLNQETCISCNQCQTICPTAAIDAKNNFCANTSECISCLDCVEICPTKSITFKHENKVNLKSNYNSNRRQLVKLIGGIFFGAVILFVMPIFQVKNYFFIRPPGTDEQAFSNRCIRCGECARVCPTGVIQPSYSVKYLEVLWTPILMTRLGYCDYSCTLCGEVCPTGTITKLSLERKQKTVIGIAHIDEKRCIPWAQGTECIVCEEMCPIPEKAIKLEKETLMNSFGEISDVLLPRVIPDLCIGCGICEYKCPVEDESAIRIYTAEILKPRTIIGTYRKEHKHLTK
ncbi:4Fe-4S dicluster domain-containing protein [[Eubacterium] cellulosolvens]